MSEYCICYQIQGHYKLVNNISLVLGWLGALGLSILCNFQVGIELLIVLLNILYLPLSVGD